MNASTFDTLTAARDLEAAGVERRQAEAIAEGMRQAAGAGRDELATRADLADVRAEIARLHTRLVKWGIGLAFAVAGVTTAAVIGALRIMLAA